MQFTLPTTHSQMVSTLSQIFHYYRVSKTEYQAPQLLELSLPNMEYTVLTDEELKEKAKTIVSAEQEKDIFNRKNELLAKLKSLQTQIENEQENLLVNEQKITELYEKSQEKLNKTALANGFMTSTIYMDKTAYLENEKNSKIAQLHEEHMAIISSLDAQVADCEQKLSTVESYFADIHEKQVVVKTVELKDAQEETIRQVLKYNNSLEEKRQRVENDNIKTEANLRLRHLEVKVAAPNKDQLIEMGYYEDVITCVCGYYDTMTALSAYQKLATDTSANIYLEDYFQNVIYMYGVRAGVFS